MTRRNHENPTPHNVRQNRETEKITVASPKLVMLEQLLAILPSADRADFMAEHGLAINSASQEPVPLESNNGVLTIGDKLLVDDRLRRAASILLPRESAPDTDLGSKEVKNKLQDVFIEICRLAQQKAVMVKDPSLPKGERGMEPEPLLMLDEKLHHPDATLQLLTRIPGISVSINHDRIDLVIIYQGSTYWATHNSAGVNGLKLDGTFTMLRGEGKKTMYTPRRDERWKALNQAELFKFLNFALLLIETGSETYDQTYTPREQEEIIVIKPKPARRLMADIKQGKQA